MSITPLHWDAPYAIVLQLMARFPQVAVETVGLEQLRQWIIALPGFEDDPHPTDDHVLEDILKVWYEEAKTSWN